MQFSRSSSFFFLKYSFLLLMLIPSAAALAQVTGTEQSSQSQPASETETAQVVKKQADPYKRDFAVSVFYQNTKVTNGNFVREGTTSSGGPQLSFRQSARWWAGYEINYGYTRYSEYYDSGFYAVKHGVNEFSVAYLLKAPSFYYGLRPFLSLGPGVIIFNPTSYGGGLTASTPATQTLPMFTFTLGAEHNITQRLGVRVQYRDDTYKAPNFKLVALDAHKLRNTPEAVFGVYYRF